MHLLPVRSIDRSSSPFVSVLQYFLLLLTLIQGALSEVISLDSSNHEATLQSAPVVFINFYADWCRFSQMLEPIFKEASEKFPDKTKAVFAKVDCDRQPEIAGKYQISKYPTLKLVRYGQAAKREYRGQRNVEAIETFIKEQLVDAFRRAPSPDELETQMNKKKPNMIAYFSQEGGEEWNTFLRVSGSLKDDCDFWAGVGDPFKNQLLGGNSISFRGPGEETAANEQVFSGKMNDEKFMREWILDKCVPLVREITFENAEELTEEGLPFLILFRNPSDEKILETFTQEVARQLTDQRSTINALHADGRKFAHPLHHLGKAEKDLPVIAIDSFRHMYLFPKTEELTVQGKLTQFVKDLHSGKLHQDFHNPPEEPQPPAASVDPPGQPKNPGQQKQERQPLPPAQKPPTDPPESTFNKLKPSEHRYTILDKIEL